MGATPCDSIQLDDVASGWSELVRLIVRSPAKKTSAEIAEERAEDRGSVMGVYSVLLAVGQLLGSGLAAPFADRLGINGLIILTGLLCLVALFTVMLLGQSERRFNRALSPA